MNKLLILLGILAATLIECSLCRAAPVTLKAPDFQGTWKFATMGVSFPVKFTFPREEPTWAMTAGLTPNGSLTLVISYGETLSITMPGETCLRFVPTKQVGKRRLSGVLKLQDENCLRDLGEEAPFKARKIRG